MVETTHELLAVAAWVRTILVVVFLLVVVVQLLRLKPPACRRGDAIADSADLSSFLGRTGRCVTPLRPVGTCEFDRRKVECIAESEYVEKGTPITVIRVEGTQPIVRVAGEAK